MRSLPLLRACVCVCVRVCVRVCVLHLCTLYNLYTYMYVYAYLCIVYLYALCTLYNVHYMCCVVYTTMYSVQCTVCTMQNHRYKEIILYIETFLYIDEHGYTLVIMPPRSSRISLCTPTYLSRYTHAGIHIAYDVTHTYPHMSDIRDHVVIQHICHRLSCVTCTRDT